MVKPTRAKLRSHVVRMFAYGRDGQERWRNLLTAAAVVATLVGGWLYVQVEGESAANAYSPGPVTLAHAAWENDCAQCHAPNGPQRLTAYKLPLQSDAEGEVWGRIGDQKCRRCHPVSGRDEQSSTEAFPIAQHAPGVESPEHVTSCASCHREHPQGGRLGDIVTVANQQCVRCHEDLQSKSSGKPACQNELTSLDNHPPSASRRLHLEKQPSIKFTHHRHMAPGLLLETDAAKQAFQARTGIEADKVALKCATCHSGYDSKQLAGAPASIADLAMPNFEQHCKSCHQLSYLPGGDLSSDNEQARQTVTDEMKDPAGKGQIPHGLTPPEMEAAIIADQKALDEFFVQPKRARELPGAGDDDAGSVKTRREEAVNAAKRHLQKRCVQCHFEEEKAALPRLRPVAWTKNSAAPPVMKKARFNHRAHAFAELTCANCHENAAGIGRTFTFGESTFHAGVTIPDVDQHDNIWPADVSRLSLEDKGQRLFTCVQCHGSSEQPREQQATTNCVSCHRYHGSSTRKPKDSGLEALLSTLTTPPPPPAQPPAAAPHKIGMQTCAAVGCHGASSPSGEVGWNSSYSAWLRRDPHSRAYDVLFNRVSKQMVANLIDQPLTKAGYQRFLQQRCVGCHATATRDDAQRGVLVADGVSCESCHGAASDWESAHTKADWASHRTAPGFVDTADLNVRAQQCVQCHVGSIVADGRRYEVNHDLIAAGHPRLQFEFSAYMANLPRHWGRGASKQGKPRVEDESNAERWLLGRRAAASEFIQQLRWRAKQNASAGAERAADTSPRPPWPEFAEYACETCHHDLNPQDVRPLNKRMPWGSWYLSKIDEPSLGLAKLNALRDEMGVFRAKAGNAHALGEQLESLEPEDGEPFERLKKIVIRDSQQWPVRTWDDVAQWHLAAHALLDDAERRGTDVREAKANLELLRSALDYPFVGPSAGKSWRDSLEARNRLRSSISELGN